MKRTFIFTILFISIIYSYSYSYELRLHFSGSYVANDILFADVYIGDNLLNDIIKRYVENGVVLFLNYRVDLLKKNFLFNDNVRQVFLYRKIYYDFFTQEYVVLNSETMRESRNTNLYILLRSVYSINAIPIVNINNLEVNSLYFFRTRLSMQLQNAYPYLAVFFNLITPIQYRIKWLNSETFTLSDLNHYR